MITSAVLADESPPLWISHAAQKSVLDSSERGIAAAHLYAGRRVRTLIDAPTGVSAGVITTAQLDSLLPITAGSGPSGTNDLSLSADQISRLRRRTEPGLMFTLRHIFGKASDLKLALSLTVHTYTSSNSRSTSQRRNSSGVLTLSSMTAV